MGIGDYPFLGLVQKLRSWFEMSGSCCHECRGASGRHRCRSCGRLFCRKCMQAGGGDRPGLCRFCSHAIGGGVEGARSVPESPLSRLRHSLSNFSSSPRSSRSDEEEDGEYSRKHFFIPQDVSDVDSVSVNTVLDLSCCNSVNSSPLDSPVRGGGGGGDTTGDNSPLYPEDPSYFKKAAGDAEDEGFDSLSVYRNHEKRKVQQSFDFENNRLIWDPPLAEDENDDVETGFIGYDDEDDDVSDSYSSLSTGSFSTHSLSLREKPSDAHKEQLRTAVHGHFRALVCQLLRGEGIEVGGDSKRKGWLDVVSSLAWQAATFVKPGTGKGSSMDPGNYVKVKCILSGTLSDSFLVKGVVCTKNVKHKRMVSQHKSPRLFLLGGALEYQRVTNKLASINTVLEQETDHLKMCLSRIEAHRPNVLLVEKSVSSFAQEYLLTKEISLVLNVKRALLERIARCTGGQIAQSVDNISSARLGHCEMFRVERFYEECSHGSQPKRRTMKTLMFFEGCSRRLGCTVVLRGTDLDELKKVKHIVQYASFAAYHLSRETSFLVDEGATLPKVHPSLSMSIPAKASDADTGIVKSSVTEDAHHDVGRHNRRSPCSSPLDTSCSNNSLLVGDTGFESSEELIGTSFEERRNLKLYKNHEGTEEVKVTIDCENEPADYFAAADNQSILVSLSSTCVAKGTVCEPLKLFRIKFYGSFDKPLGRFLRDDLFDQSLCCRYCKEPVDAHVQCYTHQHGSLTISVYRHPSKKLPGERDGRIWMWHRCLKCEFSDGIPPATRRVVMSDAAWGLSFGKFLELSFSNHATANRVASCGHSLQKDCLRFYGSGSMVAFFRYSPVDILSVQLPPLMLDFSCSSQREWVKREAAVVASKVEFLHTEVNDVLQAFENRISTSEHEPVKTSIQKYIMELKDLLKRERNEYDALLQASAADGSLLFQKPSDILELNRIRRFLLIDCHMWDRRLCLLDSFSKSKISTSNLNPQISEIVNQTRVKDWKIEAIDNDGRSPEELISKSASFSRRNDVLNLHFLAHNSNNLVETDWSIESVEGYTGSAAINLGSGQYYDCDDEAKTASDISSVSSSLERLPSAASTLSDKIDLLWSGNPDADAVGSLTMLDNPLHKKVILPLRVNSFDSGLRSRGRLCQGLPPAALHLSSVRSFDSSGNLNSLDIQQRSPKSKRVNFLPGNNPSPVFISSAQHMVDEGARLLLPQTGNDDLVIVLYDNEPTTIISYAISCQDHSDFITLDRQFPNGTSQSHQMDGSSTSDHFRISFDDDSSIPNDKVKFSVTCYFAMQFAALRRKCCPIETDFLCSLSRCKRWNAQGGKSNVFFAKSLDERFIVKQVTKTELDSFELFASKYFEYMTLSIETRSPTCLAKILGIYQVTTRHLKGGREVKMDLMVMENLFFGRNLSKIYDLKGSLRARYNPDTSGNDSVLLDLNLLESLRTKPIYLGSKAKRRLERAIWNDTSFLSSVDVMDYSLLVGIDDERKELVIGIIDIMRQYTWDKHLETWVKASGILGGPKNESPTVVSPFLYKRRFRKAMTNYFLTVPDQWSSP